MSDPVILIPARMASTRLPGKPLADICGEPMIVHVWRRAMEAGRPRGFEPVSPRMFYELARRYDEWPGDDYEGSSCRGALKGWHKHGACAERLWPHRPARGGARPPAAGRPAR